MPPWTAPPFINPSVSNGTSVAWFQGNETTKLPAYDNFNFSIQRQLGSSMVARGRLQRRDGLAPADRSCSSTTRSIPKYLTAFGTVAQSITVLNSLVGSAAANAAGVIAPFPGSTRSGAPRHGGAGAAALPAVHVHRHLRRARATTAATPPITP